MSPLTENKKFFVPKNLRWALLAGSAALMSVTMPSCPGQQAMQEQIDALKASQTDIAKRIQNDQANIKQIADAINQLKTDSQGIGGSVTQMKSDLDQLRMTVQAMNEKLAAATAKSSKSAKGKAGRRR